MAKQRSSKVRMPINTLSGGVGRTPPSKRKINEAQELDNCLVTLEKSLEKRNGFKFVDGGLSEDSDRMGALDIPLVSNDDDVLFQWLDLDGDNRFLVAVNSSADTFDNLFSVFKVDRNGEVSKETVDTTADTYLETRYNANGDSYTVDTRTEFLDYITTQRESFTTEERLKLTPFGSSIFLLNRKVDAGFEQEFPGDALEYKTSRFAKGGELARFKFNTDATGSKAGLAMKVTSATPSDHNGDTFVLIDSYGKTVTFTISSSASSDTSDLDAGTCTIGISGSGSVGAIAAHIHDAIELFEFDAVLATTDASNDTINITQKEAGSEGNTSVTETCDNITFTPTGSFTSGNDSPPNMNALRSLIVTWNWVNKTLQDSDLADIDPTLISGSFSATVQAITFTDTSGASNVTEVTYPRTPQDVTRMLLKDLVQFPPSGNKYPFKPASLELEDGKPFIIFESETAHEYELSVTVVESIEGDDGPNFTGVLDKSSDGQGHNERINVDIDIASEDSPNGQSVKSFDKIPLPPASDDATNVNGAENYLSALYGETSDDRGKGKVWFTRESFGPSATGYYRTTDVEKSPFFTRVRTPDPNGVFKKQTMPILLDYVTADNKWVVKYPSWSFRNSGNERTNPGPTVFENGARAKITDMCLWRNRLWLAADDTVFSSETNNQFNFWINDPDNLVDTDPIDIRAGSEKLSNIASLLPFKDYIFVNTFGNTQYEILGSDNQITPFTAKLAPTTFYSTAPLIDPVAMGSQIYFFSPRKLFLYFSNSSTNNINQTIEMTKHCEGYLPKDITILEALPNKDMIVMVDKMFQNTMYVGINRWEGDRVAQNAFFKWTLPLNSKVLSVKEFDNDIYITVARTWRDAYGLNPRTSIFLQKMGMTTDPNTTARSDYRSAATEYLFDAAGQISVSPLMYETFVLINQNDQVELGPSRFFEWTVKNEGFNNKTYQAEIIDHGDTNCLIEWEGGIGGGTYHADSGYELSGNGSFDITGTPLDIHTIMHKIDETKLIAAYGNENEPVSFENNIQFTDITDGPPENLCGDLDNCKYIINCKHIITVNRVIAPDLCPNGCCPEDTYLAGQPCPDGDCADSSCNPHGTCDGVPIGPGVSCCPDGSPPPCEGDEGTGGDGPCADGSPAPCCKDGLSNICCERGPNKGFSAPDGNPACCECFGGHRPCVDGGACCDEDYGSPPCCPEGTDHENESCIEYTQETGNCSGCNDEDLECEGNNQLCPEGTFREGKCPKICGNTFTCGKCCNNGQLEPCPDNTCPQYCDPEGNGLGYFTCEPCPDVIGEPCNGDICPEGKKCCRVQNQFGFEYQYCEDLDVPCIGNGTGFISLTCANYPDSAIISDRTYSRLGVSTASIFGDLSIKSCGRVSGWPANFNSGSWSGCGAGGYSESSPGTMCSTQVFGCCDSTGSTCSGPNLTSINDDYYGIAGAARNFEGLAFLQCSCSDQEGTFDSNIPNAIGEVYGCKCWTETIDLAPFEDPRQYYTRMAGQPDCNIDVQSVSKPTIENQEVNIALNGNQNDSVVELSDQPLIDWENESGFCKEAAGIGKGLVNCGSDFTTLTSCGDDSSCPDATLFRNPMTGPEYIGAPLQKVLVWGTRPCAAVFENDPSNQFAFDYNDNGVDEPQYFKIAHLFSAITVGMQAKVRTCYGDLCALKGCTDTTGENCGSGVCCSYCTIADQQQVDYVTENRCVCGTNTGDLDSINEPVAVPSTLRTFTNQPEIGLNDVYSNKLIKNRKKYYIGGAGKVSVEGREYYTNKITTGAIPNTKDSVLRSALFEIMFDKDSPFKTREEGVFRTALYTGPQRSDDIIEDPADLESMKKKNYVAALRIPPSITRKAQLDILKNEDGTTNSQKFVGYAFTIQYISEDIMNQNTVMPTRGFPSSLDNNTDIKTITTDEGRSFIKLPYHNPNVFEITLGSEWEGQGGFVAGQVIPCYNYSYGAGFARYRIISENTGESIVAAIGSIQGDGSPKQTLLEIIDSDTFLLPFNTNSKIDYGNVTQCPIASDTTCATGNVQLFASDPAYDADYITNGVQYEQLDCGTINEELDSLGSDGSLFIYDFGSVTVNNNVALQDFITGEEYKMTALLSSPTYRDQNQNTIDGVFKISKATFRHFNTGRYRVNVRDARNDSNISTVKHVPNSSKRITDIDPIYESSINTDYQGEFSQKILANANDTFISITSRFFDPLNITNIELHGNFIPLKQSSLEK